MAHAENGGPGQRGKRTVLFVATTPFAINSFLAAHVEVLSEYYRVVICTNFDAYEVSPSLLNLAKTHHIAFARKIAPITDLSCLLQLFAAIRQYKPAAIHSITPKAGLLAMIAGLLACVPNRWHTFTGQVWVTRRGLARRFLRSLDRLIALAATRIFADSDSQCRLLCEEGVVRHEQIRVLGQGSISGVDVGRFRPNAEVRNYIRTAIGSESSRCVFLFVGRLARDKGLNDLVRAFHLVVETVRDVELWIVGPDEDRLLKSLQEATVGIKAPVRWMAATPSPEHYMAAADVLVLPSYREGFGSVIIEGAACGIPAIAYRIDGVIDAIVDGSTGLLVEVGQPVAFAAAMKRLSLDKELRLRLGKQARERTVRDFSSESVTNAWLEFYLSHLSQQHETTR